VALSCRRLLTASLAVLAGSAPTWGYSDRVYVKLSDGFLRFGEGFVNIVLDLRLPFRWASYSSTVSDVPAALWLPPYLPS